MGEIDGRHMAGDDGRDCRVPGKARADDSDVDAIASGAEQIPAPAERIGEERDDVLPLHQQEHQVVRHVIADGDRDQRQGEAARDLERRRRPDATQLMTAHMPR